MSLPKGPLGLTMALLWTPKLLVSGPNVLLSGPNVFVSGNSSWSSSRWVLWKLRGSENIRVRFLVSYSGISHSRAFSMYCSKMSMPLPRSILSYSFGSLGYTKVARASRTSSTTATPWSIGM
jgi:hypothetical protein